jgi:hypothetical protein
MLLQVTPGIALPPSPLFFSRSSTVEKIVHTHRTVSKFFDNEDGDQNDGSQNQGGVCIQTADVTPLSLCILPSSPTQVRPLKDSQALTKGAEFMGEAFIFAVGSLLLIIVRGPHLPLPPTCGALSSATVPLSPGVLPASV